MSTIIKSKSFAFFAAAVLFSSSVSIFGAVTKDEEASKSLFFTDLENKILNGLFLDYRFLIPCLFVSYKVIKAKAGAKRITSKDASWFKYVDDFLYNEVTGHCGEKAKFKAKKKGKIILRDENGDIITVWHEKIQPTKLGWVCVKGKKLVGALLGAWAVKKVLKEAFEYCQYCNGEIAPGSSAKKK